MDAIEMADLVVEPVCVDLGMLGQCESDPFDHDVIEGDLVLIAHLGELSAHLRRACGVELGGEKESRNGAIRLGEPARILFSDRGEWTALEAAFGREPVCRSGPSSTTGRLGVFDVALDDAPAWAAALDSAELESSLV